MRHFVLNETNWKFLKNNKVETAILPWGATEPHNYHLPYGTDNLETTRIAEVAVEKAWQKGAKAMVLPTIPLGMQNKGQTKLPFCLNVSLQTQISIIEDIVESLSSQGITKFIILNGHGGNDFKQIIRGLSPKYPDMFLGIIEWFKLLHLPDYFDDGGDHAGEMETSLMLYLFPELVLPLSEAGDGKSKSFKLTGLQNKTAWTPRDWDKISTDTGVGNPKSASAEKGKKYFSDLTDNIADFIIELANSDPLDIYE